MKWHFILVQRILTINQLNQFSPKRFLKRNEGKKALPGCWVVSLALISSGNLGYLDLAPTCVCRYSSLNHYLICIPIDICWYSCAVQNLLRIFSLFCCLCIWPLGQMIFPHIFRIFLSMNSTLFKGWVLAICGIILIPEYNVCLYFFPCKACIYNMLYRKWNSHYPPTSFNNLLLYWQLFLGIDLYQADFIYSVASSY